VEYSASGSASFSGPWVPPITITGQNVTGNAVQRIVAAWNPLLDGTYNQGVPFVVKGIITGSTTSVTWSPIADLYTDPSATPAYAYTGTPATTVWAKPPATVTYTATASTAIPCSSSKDVTITVTPNTKTLIVKAYLEGLYNGVDLNQAFDDLGPHFATGIADQVYLELHSALDYATIVYPAVPTLVDLSTGGIITVTGIPASLSGSYYITIKHRNSIETTSATAVSFAGGTINYDFTTAASQAYGNNMTLMGTVYAIWGGDVNQDGYVDTGDMNPVENESTAFTSGYVPEDANGDGFVDTSDMNIVENNSTAFVGIILP
jgi:hypothetical protein